MYDDLVELTCLSASLTSSAFSARIPPSPPPTLVPSMEGTGTVPFSGAKYSDDGLYSLPLSEAESESELEEAEGAGAGSASVGEAVSENNEGAMVRIATISSGLSERLSAKAELRFVRGFRT